MVAFQQRSSPSTRAHDIGSVSPDGINQQQKPRRGFRCILEDLLTNSFEVSTRSPPFSRFSSPLGQEEDLIGLSFMQSCIDKPGDEQQLALQIISVPAPTTDNGDWQGQRGATMPFNLASISHHRHRRSALANAGDGSIGTIHGPRERNCAIMTKQRRIPDLRPLECPDAACSYIAKTRRDIERHFRSVHQKAELYFCATASCPRSRKGWSRRDLRDRHARTQHIAVARDGGTARTALAREHDGTGTANSPCGSSSALSEAVIQSDHGEVAAGTHANPSEEKSRHAEGDKEMDHRSLGLPQTPSATPSGRVGDLVKQLRWEQERRMALEEEIRALRKRYDEREDMWLKALAGRICAADGSGNRL